MRRDAKILVVDDEPANVRLLERILGDAGCRALSSTTDARQVLDLDRGVQPDLIVLDLMMPHLDGMAVLEQLRAEIPATAYVPVLVLTADATPDAKRRALAAGAHDFLTKPFEHFEAVLRIGNLLATRRLYLALEEHNRALEDTVKQRTERLLQSEKVAAMGSLLAGVAHELNNPLTVLSAQAQLLDEADVSTFAVRTAKIRQAADRCVRIVPNFLGRVVRGWSSPTPPRHHRRRPGADLRAVLHDEAPGRGDRARPLPLPRDHRGARPTAS